MVFLKELQKHKGPLSKFDDKVWQATVHQLKMLPEGRALFVFRDGTELPWNAAVREGKNTSLRL